MEQEGLWSELDMGRETRGGLEYREERGVFLEEFGGCDREVEVGFEQRGCREREGLGRVGDDLVLEGNDLFKVFLSFNCVVQVWISDPFYLGVYKGPDGVEPVGKQPNQRQSHDCESSNLNIKAHIRNNSYNNLFIFKSNHPYNTIA